MNDRSTSEASAPIHDLESITDSVAHVARGIAHRTVVRQSPPRTATTFIRYVYVIGNESDPEEIPTVTSTHPSTIDEYPLTLRDGRALLVGLIDGYPNYYDRRRHRIDVLLEESDGSRYLSEYYQLRPGETVREYVERAKRDGHDCTVLAQWGPKREGYRPRTPVPRRLRRRVRALYVRLARLAR